MIHGKDHNNDNFVNIYANTDRRMKELGQILKTPKSRRIYHILMDKELHTKEIGMILENEPNPRLPNLTHHLKKMTSIGLLHSTLKMKNGHALTYYTAVKYLIIVPEDDIDVALKSKTLKSTLRRVFKISSIGAVGVISFLFLHQNKSNGLPSSETFTQLPIVESLVPFVTANSMIELERIANFFKMRHSINIERYFLIQFLKGS